MANGATNNCMKTRHWLIIAILLLLVGAAAIMFSLPQRQPAVRVTGPLTKADVSEITRLVLAERAPLLSGEFAARDRVAFQRHLRERVAGNLRSIATVDGQYVVVDFGDRLNPGIGYDYDLRRATNGWRIVGVGYREPAKPPRQ
jgi:hypothetical protein